MTYFLTNLAGLNFRPATAKDAVRALIRGDELKLVRDPDNAYDSDAIQIWSAGEFIGFVEAVTNPPIADLMDGGTELTAQIVDVYAQTEDKGDKRWMRPLIRIEVVGEELHRPELVDVEGEPLDYRGRPINDDDIPF